jgi:hypothetical protein
MSLELIRTELAPDQMMPSQYADLRRRRTHSSGEALAYAILARAVMDLRPPGSRRSRAARRIHNDAYRWMLSNDRTYVFSFINVCEFLGFNPYVLRRGLLGVGLPHGHGTITVHEAA